MARITYSSRIILTFIVVESMWNLTSCFSSSNNTVLFPLLSQEPTGTFRSKSISSSKNNNDLSSMATSRFPTSLEDQIRQASISVKNASNDKITRHSLQLLLPLIGPTELDDWPGGARQMMDAASPLVCDILKLSSSPGNIQESVIDTTDGVRAVFFQSEQDPIQDSCTVLLPSADTIDKLLTLDKQVGNNRNLMIVNSQWRRRSDFASFIFAPRTDHINFVEGFYPTFYCSNIMVEGDIVRILRTYPGPWRVYLRVAVGDGSSTNNMNDNDSSIDWVLIGTKDVLDTKTVSWENEARIQNNAQNDGGKLFDYGIPSYREIESMIINREGYVPKSLSEKASAAFTFIKDTMI